MREIFRIMCPRPLSWKRVGRVELAANGDDCVSEINIISGNTTHSGPIYSETT